MCYLFGKWIDSHQNHRWVTHGMSSISAMHNRNGWCLQWVGNEEEKKNTGSSSKIAEEHWSNASSIWILHGPLFPFFSSALFKQPELCGLSFQPNSYHYSNFLYFRKESIHTTRSYMGGSFFSCSLAEHRWGKKNHLEGQIRVLINSFGQLRSRLNSGIFSYQNTLLLLQLQFQTLSHFS